MREWLDNQREYIEEFDLYTWYMDQFWSEALKELVVDDLEAIGIEVFRQ